MASLMTNIFWRTDIFHIDNNSNHPVGLWIFLSNIGRLF